MLKLESARRCMWRNMYAPHPVLAATVSFCDAFGWTTERLSPAVLSLFEEKLPGAVSRSGAVGAPELVARLAQHIQLFGDLTPSFCGVASRDDKAHTADLFFSCRDHIVAPQSLSFAIQIVDRLTRSDPGAARIAGMLKTCEDVIQRSALTERTHEMIQAAERFDIPWFRTNNLVRHVQLGQGFRQQRFWNTMFSSEPSFGRDYAKNKLLTMSTLSQLMLPVGQFAAVRDIASAQKFAAEIGYPVVLKPIDGGKGDSVYVDLRDEAELKAALQAARIDQRPYMLQSFFPGEDYRLIVVGGKLLLTIKRVPASVAGDGRNTIAELVEIENRNPVRTSDNTMAPIVLDAESDRILARQGYNRDSVVSAGQVVRVKGMANVATGGTVVAVTETIHPDNVNAALRAAQAIGLVITGVDFVSPDISKSWREVGGGFCEVNTTIGLPHETVTPGFDLRAALVRTFYPEGNDGRIPTAIVAGTFGTNATCLMLAGILAAAGHTVGSATAESIRIGDEVLAVGDFASIDGAAVVLRDATVTAAVLEAARGDLIERGLYLDRCDVAALLHAEHEQIDIATLKRKMLESARKALVLNADDLRCLAMAPEFASSVRTFLFSCHAESQALRDHRQRGGDTLFLEVGERDETIMLASGEETIPLLKTAEIPIAEDGSSRQHSSNAMAAAALAIGLGIDLDTIRIGLRRDRAAFKAMG